MNPREDFAFLQAVVAICVLSMRSIMRCLLFPGSVKLLERSSEFSFMQQRAGILEGRLIQLKEFLNAIVDKDTPSLMDFTHEDLASIYERIAMMVATFNQLAQKGPLSVHQQRFRVMIDILQKAMKLSNISFTNIP